MNAGGIQMTQERAGLRQVLVAGAATTAAVLALGLPGKAEAGLISGLSGGTLSSTYDGDPGTTGFVTVTGSYDPTPVPEFSWTVQRSNWPSPSQPPGCSGSGNLIFCDAGTISSLAVTGGDTADTITVNSAGGGPTMDASISTGGGNDRVRAGGYGARTIDGGTGSDTFAAFVTGTGNLPANPAISWTIDLEAATVTPDANASPMSAVNFENADTTDSTSFDVPQTLLGTDGPNSLSSRGGADTLVGRGGNDVLHAGSGADMLTGGPGDDTFNCGPGTDTVTDAGVGDVLNECESDAPIIVNRSGDAGDTNTSDNTCDSDGGQGSQCTLRAAIEEANVQSGADTIEFEMAEGEGKRIAPITPLPELTGTVTIDGRTEGSGKRGISDSPEIQVSGSLIPGEVGLDAQAADVAIKGMSFTKFRNAPAVQLNGGEGSVTTCWFGAKRQGNNWASNQQNTFGVEVRSPGNTIGGTEAEKNVFSASGDVADLKDYAGTLDRAGTASEAEHAGALRALGAGILVGNGASNTVIRGNEFGRTPDGDRTGSSLGFGSVKFGNVAAVAIAPTTGSASNTIIGGAAATDANVFSGNMGGIWAIPGASASISGLDIHGNLIGPKAPNKASSFFGNVIGVMASGNTSGLDIGGAGGLGNDIQGNILGVVLGGDGVDGATIHNNEIGTDRDLFDMVEDLTKKEPSIGLHNFFGVLLGDTQDVAVGGAAGLGNQILGNLIGVQVGGSASEGNTVAGNTIGLTEPPDGRIEDLQVGKFGAVLGLLHTEGTENAIGDGGVGNQFIGDVVGLLSAETTQETVQANSFDKNGIGQIAAAPAGATIGGTTPALANTYSNSAVGLLMAHREMKNDEREASRAADATAKRDRKAPYTSDNSDIALDTAAPMVGDTDLSANAAVIETPPAPGTGNMIQGNYFGTNAGGASQGNWLGAWLLGDISNSTFGTGSASMTAGANTVAHNKVAGVWVGPPVSGTSQVDLRGNSIFDNHTFTGPSRGLQGLGIDLLPPGTIDSGSLALSFGISPNDAGDADVGGNGRQNHPVISSATTTPPATGTALTVAGTLDSTASITYSIELYASTNCGRFAYGEGETLIKRYDVTTNGVGTATVDTTATLPAGKRKLTATATGPGGTSEFSECKTVP